MSSELDLYFEFKCRKGYDSLGLDSKKYQERLDYEIACIKKMGFSGYLLIVQDLLAWAKRNDILAGPGRGSSSGALVCYVLGITKIDPIKHGLIFERFLNPDRISMPDIDLDFSIDRREEVVDYVKDVYGGDKVARITTFSEMQAKGAIRDVARAMDLPYMDGDKLSKLVNIGTIAENLESNEDFKDAVKNSPHFQEPLDIASRLEGNIRHCVSGDTRVVMPNGHYFMIKNLYAKRYRGKIRSYSFKDDVLFFDNIVDIFCTGKKETLKITANKQDIRVTKDHLILTKDGWIEASNLKVGQLVARNGKIKDDGRFKKGQIPWNTGLKGAQKAWNKGLKKEDHHSIASASDRMYAMNEDKVIIEKSRQSRIKHGRNAKEFKQYFLGHPICEHCNVNKATLVHHIDENPKNNDYNNLKAVCRSCHSKIHNLSPQKSPNINTTIRWGKITSIEKGDIEDVYDISMESENHNFIANRFVVHNCGQHAAGVVIGDKPLNEYMPVYTSKKTGDNLTQFAMEEVEAVGLIKFDFLGLKNLSIIHMAQGLIKERHGVEVNLDDLTNSLDDEKVFRLFANGDTMNVFQFESGGMRKYLRRLKPDCFDDIVALNALYRPAGIDSGIIDEYISRKQDPTLVEYPHECMEPYLKNTFGLMVYQEDQMKTCEILAGYTAASADTIRKYVGKKILSKLKKERPKFVKGCMSRGLSASKSEALFDDLEKAGRYSFNKCLVPETTVTLSDGTETSIFNVKQAIDNGKEVSIQSYDTDNDIVFNDICIEVIDSGEQEVYEIELSDGSVIECTMQHKFLCSDNKKHELHEIIEKNLEILAISNIKNFLPFSSVPLVSGSPKIRLKILSVKPKGTKQTYNLHMKSKHHNFILGNGVVSGNSHSAAYSVIAYWTAWFKLYYPLEYMTSVLTYEIESKDDLFNYINEAKKMGIKFLPPDINKSQPKFTIEDGDIRYALGAIECIGFDTSQEIVDKRKEHGDYQSIRSLIELANSKKVTTQVVESLVKSGAFDHLDHPRSYMLAMVEPASTFKKKKMAKEKKWQLALFERVLELDDIEPKEYRRPSKRESDKYEMEALGFYLFDNPLQNYVDLINRMSTHTLTQIKECEIGEHSTKNIVVGGYISGYKEVKRKVDGKPMAFLDLSDGLTDIKVCVFTKAYAEFGDKLGANELIMFKGQFKESEFGEGEVIANKATMLEDLPKAEDDGSIYNFKTEDGSKLIYQAIEKKPFMQDIGRIFKNFTEGRY